MFFDEVALDVEGGKGGDGAMCFHREKYVAYGPPDGGNGGNGGNVILRADENYNTFRHFSGRKVFTANAGENGSKNDCYGHAAEDLILSVPVGTLVYDVDRNDLIADLKKVGDEVLVARGGRGGYGNAHFVGSTRQAPMFAELGDIGEIRSLRLEMQLVADVGLIGFPSAGKSTLISHVSSAKPKIGDYPFTTLIPNLGVVNLAQFGGKKTQSFVIADMPGIIEGASEGKGLGDAFLKHISRTALLLFVLDPFNYENRDLEGQYEVLRKEIEAYKPELLDKTYFVLMNKIDAIPMEDREALKKNFLKKFPKEKATFRMASGVSGEGLKDLMLELWQAMQKTPKASVEKVSEAEEEEKVYKPIHFVDEQSFLIEFVKEIDAPNFHTRVNGMQIQPASKPKRQLFNVTGYRIEQISRMTNVEQADAVQRVYDVFRKMGIQNALARAGAKNGDFVKIGPNVFEFHDLSL